MICTCSHPHEKVTPEKLVNWVNAVLQSISHMWLFATSWTVAHQAPLSSTISWSLLIFMSPELVMPSNHLILYRPLLNWCKISFWRQRILPYAWGHEAFWAWAISYKQEHMAEGRSWGRVVFCYLSCISVGVRFSPYAYAILYLYGQSFIPILKNQQFSKAS